MLEVFHALFVVLAAGCLGTVVLAVRKVAELAGEFAGAAAALRELSEALRTEVPGAGASGATGPARPGAAGGPPEAPARPEAATAGNPEGTDSDITEYYPQVTHEVTALPAFDPHPDDIPEGGAGSSTDEHRGHVFEYWPGLVEV